MTNIVEEAKKYFLEKYEQGRGKAFSFLPRHVENVEKWAKKLLGNQPQADKEVVLVSVWLHDIGQTVGDKSEDHAVKSEAEARTFLTSQNYPKEKIEKVAHCVRAHRCKDVQPKTLEAKILAAADSASHFTDINYIVHLSEEGRKFVEEKIERDYRDIGIFPELKDELTPVYKAWKGLIKVFPEI